MKTKLFFLIILLIFPFVMAGQEFTVSKKGLPDKIYFIYYDPPAGRIRFNLPAPNRDDIVALIFQHKESGEKFFFYGVNNPYPESFEDMGLFDLILLYNDGKFLKLNNYSVSRNEPGVIDMTNLSVNPSNADSQNLLKQIAANKKPKFIRSYVYDDNGKIIVGGVIEVKGTNKGAATDIDGFCELNTDSLKYPVVLNIFYIGCIKKEIILNRQDQDHIIEVIMDNDYELLKQNIIIGDMN
ncbi:MAG: carboxypeptidase-like regulatory domain-containing protein [Tannerella sp.]|nr:carboxypeptidase-like regulatory domain-containing protein [Tannerella sp.]